jgi:hypothetical protein
LTTGFHGVESASDGALQLQPVIPFRIGRQAHLVRVSAAILVESVDFSAINPPPPDRPPPNQVPAGKVLGLQDMAIVDVMVWRTSFGSWGVGPVVSVPTATDPLLGSGKFSVGPAFVVIMRKGPFQGGFLAQGFFSVAGKSDREDVDVVALQPLAGFGLPANWSVGISEINVAYDTRRGKWTSVPLGGRLERLVTMGRLPVRLYADAEYNFVDTTYAPRWTFRFTFTPLL